MMDAAKTPNRQASKIVSPAAWMGETCVVGPFSSKYVAEYFAGHSVEFGQLETLSQRIFVKGDAWYVEIGEVVGPKLGTPPQLES